MFEVFDVSESEIRSIAQSKRELSILRTLDLAKRCMVYETIALLGLAPLAIFYGRYKWAIAYAVFAVPFLLSIRLVNRMSENARKTAGRDWNSPSNSMASENERIKSTLTNLCSRFGIVTPALAVRSELTNPPLFFHPSGGESGTIVICERLSKILSADALESAIMHELYHAKTSVSSLFLANAMTTSMILGYVGIIFYCFLMPWFVALPFFTIPRAWNWWLPAIAEGFLLPGAFALFWVLTFRLGRDFTGDWIFLHHEYFADWFASIRLRQPKALSQALSVIGALNVTGSPELAKLAKPISVSDKDIDDLPKILLGCARCGD